jgi:hypothetical protein
VRKTEGWDLLSSELRDMILDRMIKSTGKQPKQAGSSDISFVTSSLVINFVIHLQGQPMLANATETTLGSVL